MDGLAAEIQIGETCAGAKVHRGSILVFDFVLVPVREESCMDVEMVYRCPLSDDNEMHFAPLPQNPWRMSHVRLARCHLFDFIYSLFLGAMSRQNEAPFWDRMSA